MKKNFIVLFLLFVTAIPAFSYNEEAEQKSIEYLNRLVYPYVNSYKQTLYVDYDRIGKIIQAYKQNPDSIKTSEINQFGAACVERTQNMLDLYKKDYFVPAYNEYKKYDTSMDLDEWINTTALSETSLFYDFYTFTESNLRDCQKIYERSK